MIKRKALFHLQFVSDVVTEEEMMKWKDAYLHKDGLKSMPKKNEAIFIYLKLKSGGEEEKRLYKRIVFEEAIFFIFVTKDAERIE